MKSDMTSDQLVRDYYRCFNDRQIVTAGTLFAPDAVVDMPPFVRNATGADAYAQFADAWFRAFPDAVLTIEHVEQRNDTMCEVDVLATGTHQGPLDLGVYGLLRPSGVWLTLRWRELLEIRDGHIVNASVSFDINQLIRELSHVDYRKLMACLGTVREVSDELAKVPGDDIDRRRDVTERLGQALDAARHAIRPHFKR